MNSNEMTPDGTGPVDEELVALARDGDTASCGQLFERYQSKIYNFAYGIVGNRDDAQDIAQEAFVKVFQALPRMKTDARFSSYLYRTAHNAAIDTVKAKGRLASPEALDLEEESSLHADPERVALFKEQQAQVRGAAFDLSDEFRTVLTLRELQDLSYTEIAAILGIPKNTVGVVLSRARLKFKGAFRMSHVDVDKLTRECQKMLPLLSAYIDGELAPARREKVERHLDDCPLCRLALEEMQEASKRYRALIPLIPPAALKADVLGRIAGMHGGPARTGQLDAAHGAGRAAGEYAGSGSVDATRELDVPRLTVGKKAALAVVALAVVALVAGGIAAFVLLGGKGGGGQGEASETLAITTHQVSSMLAAQEIADIMHARARAAEQRRRAKEAAGQATSGEDGDGTAGQTGDENGASGGDSGTPGGGEAGGDTQAPPTPTQLSPASGAVISGPDVTLEWQAVDDPSGVTYSIEIQQFLGGGAGYGNAQVVEGWSGTQYGLALSGMTQRWRVWAVDGAGNASAKSGWRTVTQAAEP